MRSLIKICLLASLIHTVPMQAQIHSYENEVGWIWQVEPRPAFKGSSATNGIIFMLSESKDGSILLTTAFSDKSSQGVYSFRAAAFDESNRRYEFDSQSGGSSNGVSMQAYRLPPDRLTWNRLKLVGIEKLTQDHLQSIVAPNTFRKLKDAGEQALSYPEIGKPYAFELKAVDGSTINSMDLAGKVVLLDFWASWCTPCMEKMPKLKETYQKLRDQGFEVIGLNHDYSIEVAKRVSSQKQLPWPLVLAPTSQQARKWWNLAAGISTLPRLWLIDRKGIMRADVSLAELDAEIQRLVNE